MRRAVLSLILLSSVIAAPVLGQSNPIDLRVGKLEKEMKAVQRKVFPAGVDVQPEIGAISANTETGTPSSAPIVDLTARIDALESQLKILTGQVETDSNRLKKVEEAIKAIRTDYDARLKALEPVPTDPTMTPIVSASTTAALAAKPAVSKPAISAPAPAKAPVTAKPDANRKASIAAVEIPATGDAGEDAYSYGYRLWSAKLYPEAQVKLKEFSTKYPKHKRGSFAQNLLGRSYLDEGKPALASVAFYENYTKNPRGERASESLYWLGVSLTKLKKLPDACKVYDEYNEVYGKTSSTDLKAKVAKGRTDAKCAS